MQLCIRQRVFAWGDTYDVYDEFGQPKYFVKGAAFSLGHQIRVYEKTTGREVGAILQRLLTLMPTFEIVVNGQVCGTVRKRFTLFMPKYDVDYKGWVCEGDLFCWDYRVMENGREVMRINKEFLTWGDTYSMYYRDAAHEIPGLLLVLAIDAANCDNDNHR